MPAWLERLIFRHILGPQTDLLLGQLADSYTNGTPLPSNAAFVIDQKASGYPTPNDPTPADPDA